MYYIQSSNGTNIAVYDLNSNARNTIVLVHGWPLNHKMFEYQLPSLLKAGYRVVLLDLRGFGDSEVTMSGYFYEQFATDLYCVITALGLYDFTLLGFSMGGAIVTKYMGLYHGYGVSKLCLLDAAVPSYCKTLQNPYGQTTESTNQLIQLGLNDRPVLNQYFGSIFFAKKQSEPFKTWFFNLNNEASGLGEMQSLIALRDENVFSELQSIKVPTAIIHGKDDKICPFGMAKIMNQNIIGSKLYPIEEAGHGAFYEEKEQVNSRLLEFLGKR